MQFFIGIFCVLILSIQNGYMQRSTYKFNSEAKTWFEAYQSCDIQGGHLAIINSYEEYIEVTNLMKSLTINTKGLNAHIGFHMLFGGDTVDILGNDLEQKDWWPGYPISNFIKNACGLTWTHNALIYEGNCLSKFNYLCEFPDKIEIVKSPDVNEATYLVINKNVTWPEARRTCRNKGGRLVIINSEQELQHVLQLIKANNIEWFWAGYHNMFINEEIILDNGDVPEGQHLKWTIPCDSRQGYGAIYMTGKSKLLSANAKHRFVCEISTQHCTEQFQD